ATGRAESRTNRTASSLNSSVDRRRVLVIILSSAFIILLLLEVSVKSGEGQTLNDIKRLGEKTIIFCEFRDMQLMLAHYIEEIFRLRPDVINGDVSASEASNDSRQKRIKEFQARPGFGAIILSPVAVGFGVNIQAANHVIHFTRTWNPAKEDQATDRAYRIGQTRKVYVYYPVVCAQEFTTFDVLLDQLLYRKRGLSGDMLNGTGNILPSEFEDVVGVGKDAFEKQLCIEDADSLEPLYFEALIAVIFPLKTRPLAGKFPCAVMGSTGGSHDTETAHGGTDHRSPEGCPS